MSDLYDPTEEHAMLRRTLRDFVRDKVEPQALEHDRAERFNLALFRELGELGYRFIFITLFGAHAAMHSVWNFMHELAKNEEQAQWTLERLKVGHPTESHHVMARVSHFQELERRFIPGTEERLQGSAGFGEGKGH